MTRGPWIRIGAAVVLGWLGTAAYALDDALLVRLDVLDPDLNRVIQTLQPALLAVSVALLLTATVGAWRWARATTASRVRALALPSAGIGLAIATLTLVGDGSRQPSDNELEIARTQGERTARIAAQLKAGADG